MSSKIDLSDLERKLNKNFFLSGSLTQILGVVNNPRSSAGEIEQALKYDPGITLKILKLANSAYYRATKEVTNIRAAIVLLGVSIIKNLTLQAGLDGYFKTEEATGLFSGPGLWLHSMGVGVCAKMICRRLHLGNAEDFFTLGMLHDIGLLIEYKLYREPFLRVCERLQKGQEELCHAEKEVFGVDHATLAKHLCEKWSMPAVLTQVVQFHHIPLEAPEDIRRTACALYAANQIVKKKTCGFRFPGSQDLAPEVLTLLGLEDIDVEVLGEDFEIEIKSLPGVESCA